MSTKKKAPATPKTPMEELLGDTLVTNAKFAKTSTASAFKDKSLVALYFSAKWCPPCRAFSPVLKDFYKAHAEKGKLEIVYISSDKSLNEWQEYYGSMPWLSLPEGQAGTSSGIKNALAQKLQIRGIPTLIVLDVQTGMFVTAQGREDVTKAPTLETIQAWAAMESVPIEEADLGGGGGPGGILGLILTILKNPIYIFGLLYFYKQFLKYLQQNSGDDAGGAIEDDAEDAPIMQEESEF